MGKKKQDDNGVEEDVMEEEEEQIVSQRNEEEGKKSETGGRGGLTKPQIRVRLLTCVRCYYDYQLTVTSGGGVITANMAAKQTT